MTPRELTRFEFRLRLLTRRGYPPEKAEATAERLLARDQALDTRRMCIECKHLQRTGGCFLAQEGRIKGASTRLTPITDVLQRCEHFDWMTT